MVGIITVTAIQLGAALAARLPSLPIGALLFAACLAVLFRWPSRWATPAVVAGGALAGLVLLGGIG